MFERRLSILLVAFSLAALALTIRLIDLQIVHGDEYRARTARTLVLRPKTLPFVRGSILDREGRVLVCDAPCWEIQVDYSVIALEQPRYLKRHVKRWKRRGRYRHLGAETTEQVEAAFLDDVRQMWEDLAQFESLDSPATADELKGRAAAISSRVSTIRRIVARGRGFEADVAEERMAHGIVKGLNRQRQIEARELFAKYPWVHVDPSSVRSFAEGGESFAHVLGRLGRVDASDIENDADAGDRLGEYLGSELKGKSGVEYAAESLLRGRRGRITRKRGGAIVDDGLVEADDGQDVTLTISGDLQRSLYGLFARQIPHIPEASGGSVVVVDVATREVLALVSYPSYDPGRFNSLYPVLRDDTERLPLRFRAVSSRYAPGSTVKPLACLAALNSGVITVGTRINCTGYLFPTMRNRWRCWAIAGTNQRKAHGAVNVVEALRGSCNIFMYTIGEQVGVDGLHNYFDMFGMGRLSGVGLREDNRGLNPSSYDLVERMGRAVTPGKGRHYAIGQGELAVTPVQMANIFATYASGRYRPAELIRGLNESQEWQLPFSAEHWRSIRQGMYEVVNDPDGTAYKYARLVDDDYCLCGKTGSATTKPWPTSYRILFEDADGNPGEEIVPAGSMRDAMDRFSLARPKATFDPDDIEKYTTWPRVAKVGDDYSHAWFGGYLQATKSNGQPDYSIEPRIAFAVLVEFGGSGGRVSGPIGRKVAEIILDMVIRPEDQERIEEGQPIHDDTLG